MKGHLLMSRQERLRKSVFDQVQEGQLNLGEASERLGISYRQCRRSYKRYREQGDVGLVHRARGRASSRAYPEAFQQQVLSRYEQRYAPHHLGPTLASEKLAEDGLAVDHETLRRWLLKAGLWHKQRHRAAYRSRRPPRARFGELVQMDGSHHHWFGPEREPACLMVMVDDATKQTLAIMAAQETTEAAMRLLWAWSELHGLPQALYTDRKNVYITEREPTLEEQLASEEPRTAFGLASFKLDIHLIAAHSPQAKGRVERRHGVFQDRLLKEIALRGLTSIEEVNQLLANGFLQDLNDRFTIPPVDSRTAHRPLPPGLKLEDVFCFEQWRTVQNDWTIRHQNQHYQILSNNRPLPRPKDKVLVRTRLDGTVHLLFKDTPLDFAPISAKDMAQSLHPEPPPRKSTSPAPKKPAQTPWRQNCILMLADTKTHE